MKEFHLAFAKARSKVQFIQLCKDVFVEVNCDNVPAFRSVEIFNRYYNLNFTPLQLARLGMFISAGKYKQELARYVS